MITRSIVPSLFLCAGLAIGCAAPPSAAQPAGGPAQPVAPAASSYEAVLLRLEAVNRSPTVVVVGVNADGREREIARLPGAWVVANVGIGNGERGPLPPVGAVSPSGLLALPSGRGRGDSVAIPLLNWEIFDLHRPGAAPIVISGIKQDIDQLSMPYVGPDERAGALLGSRRPPRDPVVRAHPGSSQPR